MKTRFLTAMLFCTIGLGYSTAQVQTEKRDRMYSIDSGTSYGTETCPFVMDERGAKKLHGTYLFVGSGERSSSMAELKFKYNISAACKMGNLHGPISVTSQYTGKYYDYMKGWIPSSGSNKLVGTFNEGVPTGTFNVVLNDGNWKLSATLKDNHFVGALSVYGIYANKLVELQGQFDQKGKMIGTWQIGDEKSLKFVNGVQVNRGTPDVQEMAQKFAAGSISKEDLRKKGYFLGEDSIPTQIVVGYILNPEFNIREMNVGFNCTPYNQNVHYNYVFKLNTLTEKGLQVLEQAIKDNRKPYFRYEGTYRQHGDVSCWTDYLFDKKYHVYYLNCQGGFTWEYGTIQQQDNKIYMTDQQKARLQNAIEQQYPNVAMPFENLISNVRNVYTYYANKTPDFDEQIAKISARDRKYYIDNFTEIAAIAAGGHYNYKHYTVVADGAYLLARTDDNNGFGGLYVNGLPIVDSLLATIRSIDEAVAIYDTESNKLLNAKETMPLRQVLQKAFVALNSGKKKPSEDISLLASIQEHMLLADTVMAGDSALRGKLEGKELSAYEKEMTTLESTKIMNLEAYENFVNELRNIQKQQQKMRQYLSLREQVNTCNTRILDMLVSSKKCTKAYQTLLKSLPLDEQSISTTLDVLTSLSTTIPSQDLSAVESALKKAKTPDEIKSAFGLGK